MSANKTLKAITRQTLIITGVIFFFLIMYMVLSHSFLVSAVRSKEEHTVKQVRISLQEVSDRMANFLNEQCSSMKVLIMFKEIRECIASRDFSFMKETSLLSLTNIEVFVIVDEHGNCIMAEPDPSGSVLKNKKFAVEYVNRFAKEKMPHFVSPPILVPDPQSRQDKYFIFVFTPIYNDNRLGGIIGLGFNVEGLFRDYFLPLESNYDRSVSCIVNTTGTLEVFKNGDLIGKNLAVIDMPSFPRIERDLKYGYEKWVDSKGEKNLIIYHPITIDTHSWLAVFKIPYSTIVENLWPFYWKMLQLLMILICIALMGIGITILTGRQLKQLKRRISALEIQIDHERKVAAVEEIAGTDYFQTLQKEAKKLRDLE